MTGEAIVDRASAEVLAFAWLRDAVMPVSAYGERVFERLRCFVPGQEESAQARARQIASLARCAEMERLDAVRDILRGVPDANGAIARASMGDVLEDAQLLELQRFCDAAQRVDALLAGIGAVLPVAGDAVHAVARTLEPGRSGKFGFYLDETFDAVLADCRDGLARAQAAFDASRGRALAEIARSLGRDEVSGDEFIVMRSDLRGALPGGVRVVREAPTYVLCAVEYGEPTLTALARRDAAFDALAEAEERVRTALSAAVRTRAAELDASAHMLGEIDVLVAAARYTLLYDCTVAEIAGEPTLEFCAGRLLPLHVQLAAQGRAFTPVDVALHDVAVLTGPNMGGKSVCLQTCGFIALCASFGLPVPARSARVGLFDEIAWLGIGADRELGGLLSSFAQEVVRLRDVLARGAARLLIFVDEFARTTTPHEGGALLVALLHALQARGACGLLATHLAGIARQARVRHFAVRGLQGIPQRPATERLDEALSALAASMDYTIVEITDDRAGSSDALALAELLGLDEAIVADARRALSSSPRN